METTQERHDFVTVKISPEAKRRLSYYKLDNKRKSLSEAILHAIDIAEEVQHGRSSQEQSNSAHPQQL